MVVYWRVQHQYLIISKSRMEGVYQISEGNDFFKDKAVVKWEDPDLLSILL